MGASLSVRSAAVVGLTACSWVIGWRDGPSPVVLQTLTALGCAGCLVMMGAPRSWHWSAAVIGITLAMVAITLRTYSNTASSLGVVAAVFIMTTAASGSAGARDHHWGSSALAMGWVLAAVLNALIGHAQAYGINGPEWSWISESTRRIATGNLRQPNQFATLMNVGLVAAVFVTPKVRTPRALLTVACVLLVTSANALSSSRIGALGLLLACAACWRWTTPTQMVARLHLLLAAATYATVSIGIYLYGAISGAGRGVLGRLEEHAPECHSRLTLWSNVLDLIIQRSWTGWGWGELDYAHFATRFEGTRFCAILDNAHNLPLHLAVELGIPAAVALIGAMAFVVIRARPWRETEPARQLAWLVIALVMLHSMVEYPLWYGPFQLAIGLAAGMLLARPATACVTQAAWPAHAQRLIGTLLMGASVYAAWDYWRLSQIYLPKELRADVYREDTLNKISSSWLFADQVRFARLTITPLTPANAAFMHELAEKTLHFSPEPAVIEKYINSARLLGRDADAAWAEQRYAAAFPDQHARWKALSAAR
ncbi:MAG: O-antigen ligase C-terminal domain-containing protein [Burkholderiales bacterium]|nr:O-antigen ligase C-terminal domain-containing protein [Burkholderiales bacterium]